MKSKTQLSISCIIFAGIVLVSIVITSATPSLATGSSNSTSHGSSSPSASPSSSPGGSPSSSASPVPTPSPLRVPGAGFITLPKSRLFNSFTTTDFAKVLMVSIEGYDPAGINVDAQAAYAYNAFRRIYAAHGILALPIAEPNSNQEVQQYCSGPLGAAPLLVMTMAKDQRTNVYVDAVYTGVQFDGDIEQCLKNGKDYALVPRDAQFSGTYRDAYYRNFVAGIQTGAAFSTSPWITKYKTWLLFPLAFLSSFAHESENYNGTVYCAAVDLADKSLIKINGTAYNATKVTPLCGKPGGLLGTAPVNI